jgi:hypothetical protein
VIDLSPPLLFGSQAQTPTQLLMSKGGPIASQRSNYSGSKKCRAFSDIPTAESSSPLIC